MKTEEIIAKFQKYPKSKLIEYLIHLDAQVNKCYEMCDKLLEYCVVMNDDPNYCRERLCGDCQYFHWCKQIRVKACQMKGIIPSYLVSKEGPCYYVRKSKEDDNTVKS